MVVEKQNLDFQGPSDGHSEAEDYGIEPKPLEVFLMLVYHLTSIAQLLEHP